LIKRGHPKNDIISYGSVGESMRLRSVHKKKIEWKSETLLPMGVKKATELKHQEKI
jgi:hypothetical protein